MKKNRMTLRQKRSVIGLLFISPWLIGFFAYYLRSLILTTQFSLSKITIAETGGYQTDFIGLDNYIYALTKHGTFNQVLVNSLQNILIDVPFIIFFSLFIAILLNTKFKGRALIRAVFFLPIILGSGAVLESLQLATDNIQGGGGAMIADLAPVSGVNVGYFLDLFMGLGLPERAAGYIIGLVGRIFDIVRASSVQIIIFIAALQSVSASLYEVSKIEGATGYETFWKVTFPMVSPLILTNVVYTIVDSFIHSEVVDMAYSAAFTNYDYGLSSAMSMISTLLVCAILLVVGALITRKTFYYN